MALTLRSKLPKSGPKYIWTPDWQVMMEMHLNYMLKNGMVEPYTVEPAKAYKFEGDLWGLLVDLNIPYELHWVILRLNGFRNPSDYTQERTLLLMPMEQTVGRYNDKFKASYNKTKS